MVDVREPEPALLKRVYRSIRIAREIDVIEQRYVKQGEAFFHVSGKGHENIAFLQPHLTGEDFLHCHYRDKALMLERGMAIREFFLSLFCKAHSHSAGRQMSAHLSSRPLNIMSTVGPVGNNALQAVGAASLLKNRPGHPLVYCGMGDGTSQQGEVLEAIAHTVREHLPVLFVIQDNSLAISTRTAGQTFFSRPDGDAAEFYGIPIDRVSGNLPRAAYTVFGAAVQRIRETREPAIVVFQVERLDNHTNADDQRVYRSEGEIADAGAGSDPLTILRQDLLENGCSEKEIADIDRSIVEEVHDIAEECFAAAEPAVARGAKAPLPAALTGESSSESPRGTGSGPRSATVHSNGRPDTGETVTMLEAIRAVLERRLEADTRVTLFGQDLEDPKGDVFGLTKGLSRAFPGRVRNSPLSESTIVGYSVGQALAGGRPVCFLQFADFFPLAFNQIWAELGSMYWRTNGDWKTPVIVMATSGGFKPGLGPFHASSMESFAAHVPGIDVFLPSTAADAAGLLNAAFESERPTVFFYPKNLLNDRTRAASSDSIRKIVPIGRARRIREGNELTLVGWGNTVPMVTAAAAELERAGAQCDVFDLRSISPWDESAVVESARRTGKLLIVQEDNLSVSMASEVAATVAERAGVPVEIRRISRPDTFVPCNFGNQLEVFPSFERVLEGAAALLGGRVEWARPRTDEQVVVIEAIGSSPADESLIVLEWKVSPGDRVAKGMIIADVEADKAVFEIGCPVDGVVEEVLVQPGTTVKIGARLATIVPADRKIRRKPITAENPGVPTVTLPKERSAGGAGTLRSEGVKAVSAAITGPGTDAAPVLGIVDVASQVGGRIVTNEEIAELCPAWDPTDIVRRTGITERFWVTEEEDSLSLAVAATKRLLSAQRLLLENIDLLVVTTGSPLEVTPSLACMLLAELGPGTRLPTTPALDINAACSGYLYALQYAYDFLRARPDGRVLLVTSEVLSRVIDTADPMTAPIFGDAATATLLVGADRADEMRLVVERPVLGAKGDSGKVLRVPRAVSDHVFMDGKKVFAEAVRTMSLALANACTQAGCTIDDLDLVVAHQANQRILNSLRDHFGLAESRVYSAIERFGNTSSSSIPLCLERVLPDLLPGQRWGLCAFGGGFTFGGAIIKTR